MAEEEEIVEWPALLSAGHQRDLAREIEEVVRLQVGGR
jgi:hypothetical protein